MFGLPHRVYLYFFGQALNITSVVMSVTMSAILGNKLAIAGGFSPTLSTLPLALQFFGLMVMTYPASMLMKRVGRRKSFMGATLLIFIAGVLGFWAATAKLFVLLCLAHLTLGSFTAFANYFRFAATDDLEPQLKAKAMSLVVSGGVIAAVLGPNTSHLLRNFLDFEEFAAVYGGYCVLAVLIFILVYFTPASVIPTSPEVPLDRDEEGSRKPEREEALFGNSLFLLAVFAGASVYGMMNLITAQTSLMMHKLNIHFSDIALAIEVHVLAMYIPSFFTGSLILRLGNIRILMMGFVIFILSAVVNIVWQGYYSTLVSLVLLGVGWNFGYIGGGALITAATKKSKNQLHRMQGVNDTGIGVATFAAAYASSVLYFVFGWQVTNMINLSIAFLGLGLTYLVTRKRSSI